MTDFHQVNMSGAPARVLPTDAVREVPFDFGATENCVGWRENLAWPMTYAEAFGIVRGVVRRLLSFTCSIQDERLRRIAVLGSGRIVALASAHTETAFCLQREKAASLRLVGGTPNLAWLRGESLESPSNPSEFTAFKPIAEPRWIAARRFARTAGWTPFHRLPSALFSPQTVAVSHNVTLRDAARREGRAIGFHHAESLLAKARVKGARSNGASGEVRELAMALARTLSAAPELEPEYPPRVRALIESSAVDEFNRAAADLSGLANMPRLPLELWSGSGGYYPARALGLEVQRRGGRVVRFAHGWFAGMTSVPEPIAFSELASSDVYVLETPDAAANFKATGAAELVVQANSVEIIGHRGASTLAQLPLDSRRPEPVRRRVVYAPTILRGNRQLMPPLLPDPIYLDWQFRLVEALSKMSIDLICKPHPEGLFRGQIHPLAAHAPTSARPFEAHMAEADVFLFDYGQSTTFAEALCSDRPVVLIDMGNPTFNDDVRVMIERRCRVVNAHFDARCRPNVDVEELAHALCTGPARADPTEFRGLLMGGSNTL